MRKNIYFTNEEDKEVRVLAELTGNSVSSLIKYLIHKEYTYSEKYKQLDLEQAKDNKQLKDKLDYCKEKGITLAEYERRVELASINWLEQGGEK